MSQLNRGAVAAALVLFAIMCLYQDWHGQDAYIGIVQSHWVDERVSVPIEMAMLAAGLIVYLRGLTNDRPR